MLLNTEWQDMSVVSIDQVVFTQQLGSVNFYSIRLPLKHMSLVINVAHHSKEAKCMHSMSTFLKIAVFMQSVYLMYFHTICLLKSTSPTEILISSSL